MGIFLNIVALTIVVTTQHTYHEVALAASSDRSTFDVKGVFAAKKSKNKKPKITTSAKHLPAVVGSSSCGAVGARSIGLSSSDTPELKKLYEYERVCGGSFTSSLMMFTSMPHNVTEANSLATDTAYRLKQFWSSHVQPLVIMEPITSAGLVDFSSYRAGNYDDAMNAYFGGLKKAGITDQMMGTWVSFPEANIPQWQSSDPNDYAADVTKTVTIQKSVFPNSKASILLQSMTYPSGWGSGKYISLSPYVKTIPVGLLDSFGYQGFPWPDTAPDYNAGHFLQHGLAIQAAKQLGVKSIWLNTGSFSRGRTESGKLVSVSPLARQKILSSVLTEAKNIQDSGYLTTINLFSQDKFHDSEAIDWSYWTPTTLLTNPYTNVFRVLVNQACSSSIKISLFVSDDE